MKDLRVNRLKRLKSFMTDFGALNIIKQKLHLFFLSVNITETQVV